MAALERWGHGMASVRFICGTQEIHLELEARLSSFLGTEDTLLYSSCFDANTGLFETLLGEEDAVVSDELNHASIIDGIRLCKARRYRYRNADLADLEARLREAASAGARFKLIATDGVFSMDGTVAPLRGICELADRHGALVMVDDSHAVSASSGPTGRGNHRSIAGVAGRVDILTGTLGQGVEAGRAAGYVSGPKAKSSICCASVRGRYLFSNSLAPAIAAASLAALDLIDRAPELRRRLMGNAARFRAGLIQAGLAPRPGAHPIVPVMLGEAALAQKFSAAMLERGVYVIGFSYPVVPHGAARIRAQVSAAHGDSDLDRALEAFAAVKIELGL